MDGIVRSFPGKAWVINLARIAHLAGVIGLGAAMLVPARECGLWCPVMIVSGFAMLALDFWANPGYLVQVKGVWMLAKLALLLAFVIFVDQQSLLFWLVLAASVLVSHAPSRLRNRRLG